MSNNILWTIKDFHGKGRPLNTSVESLSFGHALPTGSAGSRGSKGMMKDIVVTSKWNEHSPLLLQAAASGRMFDEIKFKFHKLDKGVQVPNMTYEFTDCIITSAAVSGTGDNPAVTFGINFEKADFRYSD
jgi:type VI secretion system Hcp family effector